MKERDLHRSICKLLDLKRIVYIHSRTDKPTTQAKGVPDFLFAVCYDINHPLGEMVTSAVAWEVKTDKGKLSEEQIAMHWKMQKQPNAWNVKVIRSLDEAIQELENLGV